MIDLDTLASAEFCYLTTVGRVSGRLHTIEIWFALRGATALLLAGSHTSDWVQNIAANPAVTLRIGERVFEGCGRLVADHGEDQAARDLMFAKYQPGSAGDLREWQREALSVAIDLDARAAG